MNLQERYLSRPDHYLIISDGGFGKTMSLKYFASNMMGKKIDGKAQAAIYIPMNELNYMDKKAGILLAYLERFFSSRVSRQAIWEMLENTKNTTEYIFLLDGVNEVYDCESNGQTVMDYICEDIRQVMQYPNVHVILSTRRKETIPEELREAFKIIRFQSFSNEKIRRYLGMKEHEVLPEHLKKILRIPMFLKLFKVIYQRQPALALAVTSKFELLELYFKEEIEIHKKNGLTDHAVEVRTYTLEYIIPGIAYDKTSRLLAGDHVETQKESSELKQAARAVFDNDRNRQKDISFEAVSKMLDNIGVVDEKLSFKHEILRDYWAVKGFHIEGESRTERTDKLENFVENLIRSMEYRKTGKEKDLARRTRWIDLAEFFYSTEHSRMDKTLWRYGVRPEDTCGLMALNYYQELTGLYDDLGEGDEAYLVAWTALEHLEKMKGHFDTYERAERSNFIYYSLKWDLEPGKEEKNKKILNVIVRAKEDVDQIPEQERDGKLHDLYGRILSNIGAYFYKLGDYKEAEKWHLLAMEYKKMYCSTEAAVRSYQTLMSDAYFLGEPLKGYRYYKEALEELYRGRTLEQCLLLKDLRFPEDFVERVMGSEVLILAQANQELYPEEIRENILDELPAQILYVYEKATGYRRNNTKLIKDLYEKLKVLEKNEKVQACPDVTNTITEYKEKCEEII